MPEAAAGLPFKASAAGGLDRMPVMTAAFAFRGSDLVECLLPACGLSARLPRRKADENGFGIKAARREW